jgi:predicted enzyme related to lactoylglutathione lyase
VSEPDAVGSYRLCIDANDVERVTQFWVSVFGYVVRESVHPDDDWRHLEPARPALPPLTIQPVPEVKTVKNRLHLDIFVARPEPWIQRCLDQGAQKLWLSEEPDDWFQVMADPEGNEFCICRENQPEP